MNKSLDWQSIYEIIGYNFRDSDLLARAMTHSSYGNGNNQRLEFLGDSVLAFVIADYLFALGDSYDEGDMTRIMNEVACQTTQGEIIKKLNISKHLIMGHGEIMEKGYNKESVRADLYEALIAAIYLDGGIAPAKSFIHRTINEFIEKSKDRKLINNYKSDLQEYLQARSITKIDYVLLEEKGMSPHKEFTSAVYVNGEKMGEGKGKNKKCSEQMAAKSALKCYRRHNK